MHDTDEKETSEAYTGTPQSIVDHRRAQWLFHRTPLDETNRYAWNRPTYKVSWEREKEEKPE